MFEAARKNVLQFLVSAIAAAPLFLAPHNLFAVTFFDAATVRPPGFDVFMQGAPGRSWDGPLTVPIAQFAPFVNPTEWLAFGLFSGADTTIGALLIDEVAGYAPFNSFGLVDSSNHFLSIIPGAATPGFSASTALGVDIYTLAFNTPTGLYRGVDANNPDGLPHILGRRVTTAGSLTFNGLHLSLSVGDYIVYMEDLRNAYPESDQDYNDSIVILRASINPPVREESTPEIPEPATFLLLSLGMAAASGVSRIFRPRYL